MKYFLTAVMIFGLTLPLFTQNNPSTRYVPTKLEIDRFFKSKTYVVLQDNPQSEYNIKVKEGMKKFWTITPFEFITYNQFDEMRKDSSKAFLVLIQVKFPKDKIEATYNFMSVLLGSGVKKVTDMPEIFGMPISYATIDEFSWAYKSKAFITLIQNHLVLMKDKPEQLPSIQNNKNTSKIHLKELWVVEKDLAKEARSLATLQTNYKYSIKVVKPEDIEKAIEERNSKVVFLHKVGPEGTRMKARCYKIIIDAGSDQMYYWDYHSIMYNEDDGLQIKDLKILNK